jgi:CBS domain-containing protein
MRKAIVKDIERVVKQPKRLLSIKENETAAEAAKKMTSNHVGCLVVLDTQGKFAGVLTERDMLAKVLATSLSPDNVLSRDIMTPNAIYCGTDTAMTDAEQLMAKHNIRHVPIVEEGVPVGMISSRDIIAYRLRSNKAMKAAAEQLAILSARLKGPDFNDILKLVIEEVPKLSSFRRRPAHATEDNGIIRKRMDHLW